MQENVFQQAGVLASWPRATAPPQNNKAQTTGFVFVNQEGLAKIEIGFKFVKIPPVTDRISEH